MTNEKRILEVKPTEDLVSSYREWLAEDHRHLNDTQLYGYFDFKGPTGFTTVITITLIISTRWDSEFKTDMLSVEAVNRDRQGNPTTQLVDTLYGEDRWEYGTAKIEELLIPIYNAHKSTKLRIKQENLLSLYDQDPMVEFCKEITGEDFEANWMGELLKPEFKAIEVKYENDRKLHVDEIMSGRTTRYYSPTLRIKIQFAHSGNTTVASITYENGKFHFRQFGTWKETRYTNTGTIKKRIFEKIHQLELDIQKRNSTANINAQRHAMLIQDGWSVKQIVQMFTRNENQEASFQIDLEHHRLIPVWERDEKYKVIGIKSYMIKGVDKFQFTRERALIVLSALWDNASIRPKPHVRS